MSNPSPSTSNGGRARTRAIRARMDTTGENWTTASRNHDTDQPAARQLPYRVVDHDNQGWHGGPDAELGSRYVADYDFQRDLPNRTYEDLLATRGPLRPVKPISDEDSTQLRELFTTAGRRTVTTLAAALEQVLDRIRRDHEAQGSGGGWEFARRTLTAGREGSWESHALISVAVFGNGLNLAKPRRGQDSLDITALRQAGPSTRVDIDVRTELDAIITRWVTDPDRYTEVAETLAFEISSYCDDTAGPDGWRHVADQWLQPGAMAERDFRNCYRLLYSQSSHFNAGLI